MTTLTAIKRRRRRRIRITGWSALTSLLVTIVGFLTWFHIVLPADRGATLEVYRDARIVVTQEPGLVMMSSATLTSTDGVLYFPGAKVDPYCYIYPLADVAASGVTVVIMKPLMNMALLDQRDMEALTAIAPEVENWTLAGHSLGGVRACMLASHPSVTSLVLFASYCATDISAGDLEVILVTGDQDGLIEPQALKDSLPLLPPGRVTERVLVGANHASFGTYGAQPGDGVATLTPAQMRDLMTAILLPPAPEE
jgi:pimeloyl-ACP methyl ester carboxylesterase